MHRVLLVIGWVLLANPVLAQSELERHEFYGQVGGAFYTGNRGSDIRFVSPPGGPVQPVLVLVTAEFSKSFRLVGGYRYWFKEKEAVEFTFSFSANRIRLRENPVQSPLQSPLPFSWQTDMRNIAANYVRKLPTWKRLEPFATAGAGIGIFLESGDGAQAKFVVNFGIGADIRLSRRWLFRMEVRDFISAQPSEGTPHPFRLAPQGVTHGIVPTAGLVLRF